MCVCVCVCIKRISSKYNVICMTFKYPHTNTSERYGYSCLSSLSLIRSVCVHVLMYACRVHVYAQMERWIETGTRSFDTDKHVWRYVHARIRVRAVCPYRVYESGIGAERQQLRHRALQPAAACIMQRPALVVCIL